MSIRQLTSLSLLFVIVFSMTWMSTSDTNAACEVTSIIEEPFHRGKLSGEANIIENSGFETGSFNPWINQESTSYNQIQSDKVYSGEYALYMNSHFSVAPYEPVYQEIETSISLYEAPIFSAALYPTKVGNTAGQAGVDHFTLRIRNVATETEYNVYYLWSGYTYPGGDMNMNITKVMYLLFDLIPNQWNIIERNVLSDFVSFYGAPEEVSDLVVIQVRILAHTSNGDPGDFWVDDITFNYEDSTSTTTTNTTTDTSLNGDIASLLTLVISGGGCGLIIIAIILIIRQRRATPGESLSEYQW
ncbi:MAG: hypothetical protein ACTSV2_16850 [Candidatus Thorarchaeota archaeon]